MNWFLLSTTNGQERAVEAHLRDEGHSTWLPLEIRFLRPRKHRQSAFHSNAPRVRRERLIVPRTIFIQAEFAPMVGHIPGVTRYMLTAENTYRRIYDADLMRWKAVIDGINGKVIAEYQDQLAKIAARQRIKKAEWQKLEDVKRELMDRVFNQSASVQEAA